MAPSPTFPASVSPYAPRGRAALSLEALVAMSSADLERRYAAGRAPADLAGLEGAPRGRVLAVRALDWSPADRWWRRFAASRLMPWEGKSFASGAGAAAGHGGNRVRALGRHAVFPFATALAPSLVDGLPCVAIDYDVPANPRAVRRGYDELREVTPGLYLGRGMLRVRGRRRLVLWFAVDATAFDKPIALRATR